MSFHHGQEIGPYILVRELGRGAFGVVWLAERRGALATTQVALKLPLIQDVDVAEIKREAKLWVKASGHPNVLPVIEAEVHSGQIVIVSEYAADGALSKWLERYGGKAPTLAAATEMCSGILQGLSHLHSKDIVHRDLKPANVLLQGGTPRIADFGVARVLETAPGTTQGIAGTPRYMAPEAWNGVRTEQTDLWAVGVIFFELLAGRKPFPQSDRLSLENAIRNAEPDKLPADIPEKYASVVSRALQKEPTARYRSAAEMLDDLRGSVTQPNATVTASRGSSFRLRRYIGFSGFVLFGGAASAAMLLALLKLLLVADASEVPRSRAVALTSFAGFAIPIALTFLSYLRQVTHCYERHPTDVDFSECLNRITLSPFPREPKDEGGAR